MASILDPFSIITAKKMLDYGHETRTCLEEFLTALEEVDNKLAKLLTTVQNASKQAPKVGASCKPPPNLSSSISFFEETANGNKAYSSKVRETVIGGLNASLEPVSTYFTGIQKASVLASQDDLEAQSTKVINAIGKSLENLSEIHKTQYKTTSSSHKPPPRNQSLEERSHINPSPTPPVNVSHRPLPPHSAGRAPPLTDRPGGSSSSALPPHRPYRSSSPGVASTPSESELQGVSMAVATSSYAAKNTKNEFSLEKGDMMYILDQTDPTWWIACRHNRIAQVPSAAVHLLKSDPITSAPPLPSRVAPPPLPSLKRVLHKRSTSTSETHASMVKK